jgi:hypothetical protein
MFLIFLKIIAVKENRSGFTRPKPVKMFVKRIVKDAWGLLFKAVAFYNRGI